MNIDKNDFIEIIKKNKDKFDKFQNLILSHNDIGLTSIDKEDFFEKHFFDSLTVLPIIEEIRKNSKANLAIGDVGAGAGFPSIPLMIADRSLEIDLIESNHKKAEFLKNVINELELINGNVICLNVREVKIKYDIILFRAFSSLSHFFKVSKAIFKEKSTIIAMKGKISEIENELSIVKNEKIWNYITDMKIHNVNGFLWERNIVEMVWEKL